MEFIYNQLKSFCYSAAGGAIVIGGAQVDLVNADAATIVYMVIAAVGFNSIKELLKRRKEGEHRA